MKGGKAVKTQKQQQLAGDLAEEALEVTIKNVALDSEMIKASRLTCKRTKVAADARVKKFKISLDKQEAAAVHRSGLLNNITELDIEFDLIPKEGDYDLANHLRVLFRALPLLKLAVDVCSQSLEVLRVKFSSIPETLDLSGRLLGESDWGSLKELSIESSSSLPSNSTPGFLSGILDCRRGSFPALKKICCRNPSAIDIQSLHNSGFIGNLTTLNIDWFGDNDEFGDGYEFNMAPPTAAAMRNLLQNAANIEALYLTSSTIEFFNCGDLIFLKSLRLNIPRRSRQRDLAPMLARPWKKLESLHIEGAYLGAPDVVRIFEAENTLPVLRELLFTRCNLKVDALSCIRRPYLKTLKMVNMYSTLALIPKLVQLLKEDVHSLPSLREFLVEFPPFGGSYLAAVVEALSAFLSCPQIAALESLSISNAKIGEEILKLLLKIASNCPNLKQLDLSGNNLGRPAVALLLGYGQFMRAWPQLEKMGILEQQRFDGFDDTRSSMYSEHSYMKKLTDDGLETDLQSVWPGLECY